MPVVIHGSGFTPRPLLFWWGFLVYWGMFKVIVAGSRTFDDYDLLKEKLDFFLANRFPTVEIVSGACRGADKLGERYANNNGLNVRYFPANWDKYGKGAGFRRNNQMAKYADACIVFWDGSSKGTKHMIDICNTYVVPLRVVIFSTDTVGI